MKEPNKNYIYDLSELTSDEKNQLLEKLIELDDTWDDDVAKEDLFSNKYLHFTNSYNSLGEWLVSDEIYCTTKEIFNAKELFYTLENVQVDCRGLSEEQIKDMCKVFESNGYKVWDDMRALDIEYGDFLMVGLDNEVYLNNGFKSKHTITYEKFMELFSNKEENFKKLVEVLNEELTEKAYEVSYIAEKPKHPLTPVFDKAEEISENIQNVLKAYKETSNKLNYELDFNFITQLAERMAQNKHKYEPYNWQKLDNISELKQALFRHVLEIMKGNYEDDNRLFGHIESIALNCMFINYQLNNK